MVTINTLIFFNRRQRISQNRALLINIESYKNYCSQNYRFHCSFLSSKHSPLSHPRAFSNAISFSKNFIPSVLKWLVPAHPWGLCKSLVLIIKIHFFSFLAHRKLYKPVFLKVRYSHVMWPVLANHMKTYVTSRQKPLRTSVQVIFPFTALVSTEAYVAIVTLILTTWENMMNKLRWHLMLDTWLYSVKRT